MAERHPLIGDIRGLGLVIGAELVLDRADKTPANDTAEAVMYAALEKGLSIKVSMGNILCMTPPLIVSREEMDWAMTVIDASLTEVEKESA